MLHINFKNIFPSILFFIPLIPHIEIFGPYLHTDDLPVIIFITLALIYIIKEKMFYLDITGKYFLAFITFLIFQNIYINQSVLSSDIYRFLFYFVLYAFITNCKEELKDLNFPLILFIFLSSFSIITYLLEINLGVDDYQTWSIGFNPSELDYLKGRTNGFQAGGPNSFADL